MSNNLVSNVTKKVLRAFMRGFEANTVLLKTVDTQMFSGEFNPSSGSTVDIKRPHQYLSQETADGDISGGTDNSIISGKATATVQNYVTVPIPWSNKEEALELDQLQKILAPAAKEVVTKIETNLARFMIQKSGLSVGTPGTAVDAWTDVAMAGSLMQSLGITDDRYYIMSPFTVQNLAGAQNGLQSGPDALIKTAWENAQISQNFAGMKAISNNALVNFMTGACADRTGALTAAPTATYLSAKDTMTQTISVGSLSAAGVVKAGEIIEFTGSGADARSYTNPITRETIIGADGNPVKWRATVTADVTLDGSGEGDLVVTGPAIYEADGQYNNISAALDNGDVFNILGSSATQYQPNLFFAKDAFSAAFVKLPKLFSTDALAITENGIVIRVCKYSDGNKNTQKIRFDCLPAFACCNPMKAGKAFGA